MKKIRLLLSIFIIISSGSQAITISKLENIPDHILGAMLLKVIYSRANIQLEFEILPAKRSLIESSEGRVDGELQRIYQLAQDYPTLVRVPTPFTYFEVVAFSRKHTFSVSGWSSLSGYGIIGRVRGLKYIDLGLKGIKDVYDVTDTDQLMNMLDSGRLDVVVTSGFNGAYQIYNSKLNNIHQLHPAIEKYQLYHYLHIKHIKLIPIIDEVIKSMKKSGELERLRQEFAKKIMK